jgi:hypothetical protein
MGWAVTRVEVELVVGAVNAAASVAYFLRVVAAGRRHTAQRDERGQR